VLHEAGLIWAAVAAQTLKLVPQMQDKQAVLVKLLPWALTCIRGK